MLRGLIDYLTGRTESAERVERLATTHRVRLLGGEHNKVINERTVTRNQDGRIHFSLRAEQVLTAADWDAVMNRRAKQWRYPRPDDEPPVQDCP